MGIIITWDNEEHTLLRYYFEAEWSWADLFEGWQYALDMVDGNPHQVDTIVDMTDSKTWLSYSSQSVRQLGQFTAPDQLGLVIVVRANVFVQTLWDMYSRLFPAKAKQLNLRFVSTIDEARQIIADHRGQSNKAGPG